MKKVIYLTMTERQFNGNDAYEWAGDAVQSVELGDGYSFFDYLNDNRDGCDVEQINKYEFCLTDIETDEKTYYVVK